MVDVDPSTGIVTVELVGALNNALAELGSRSGNLGDIDRQTISGADIAPHPRTGAEWVGSRRSSMR